MTKLTEEQKSIYRDRIQKYKWLEFNGDRLFKSADHIIGDRLKPKVRIVIDLRLLNFFYTKGHIPPFAFQ